MNFTQFIVVGLGGFIGSAARFVTSRSIDQKIQFDFPLGTLVVNIIGSLILGFLYCLTLRNLSSQSWVLFLGTGICGGFTTFSAFALENFNLLQDRPLAALSYIGVSIVAGLTAVWIGFLVGKLI